MGLDDLQGEEKAKFTSVHVQSAGFSQSGWFFISVNLVLAFARAGKDYLLCFIPVQLYFIPLQGNLYLASRDVGKKLYLASRDGTSHYGHAATSSRQVDPPKFAAIHRSNRVGSSLARGPSFPLHTTRSAVDWGLENAGFESKTSTAVNQQPQRANTSTATQLLRVKISAQMLTIRQLIQDTVQQSRNSATIKAAMNAFKA